MLVLLAITAVAIFFIRRRRRCQQASIRRISSAELSYADCATYDAEGDLGRAKELPGLPVRPVRGMDGDVDLDVAVAELEGEGGGGGSII